jgi:hypothetical protein
MDSAMGQSTAWYVYSFFSTHASIFEMLISTFRPTAVLAQTLPGLWIRYAEVVHIARDLERGPIYLNAPTVPSGATITTMDRCVQPTTRPTNFYHGQQDTKR